MPDYLIQHGREEYWGMLDITNERHASYAHRHGMRFVSNRGEVLSQYPGYWDMIPLLLDYIRRSDTDYVFWLDADTVIRDDADLRDGLNGHNVGMTKHPGPPEHYNCGVLFLRACREVTMWLERVLDLAPGIYPWYQQDYMNNYIGMLEMHGMVKAMGNEWNSTVVLDHTQDCHIRAWHGTNGGVPTRMSLMRDYIATL